MIAVLNKQTNEVLGFPDEMSSDAISEAIQSDKFGRPANDVNPTFYETTVQPALEQSKITRNPQILYDARRAEREQDPFNRAMMNAISFGFTPANPADVKEARPVEDFIGSLSGQIMSIAGLAGVAGPVVEPIAARLGFLARGMTPGAIRAATIGSGELLPQIAGEAIRKTVTSAASAGMVGALYNGITSTIDEGKRMWNDPEGIPDAPDLVKIGSKIIEGLGWSGYGVAGAFSKNVVGMSTGATAVGGVAYAMSKAEGASEPDAQLNAIVMTAISALTHGSFTFDGRKKVVDGVRTAIGEYVKTKNGLTEVNNVDKLTADEFTYGIAKDLLRQKYMAQLQEFNLQRMDANLKQQESLMANAEDIALLEKQLQELENEGGPAIIDRIIQDERDTSEYIRRIADEVFQVNRMEGEGGQAIQEVSNAKGTGTEIIQGSQQEGVVGQEKNGLHIRNPKENGVEAKQGEEVKLTPLHQEALKYKTANEFISNKANAIRQGEIQKDGAYFSTQGYSTYYDANNPSKKMYDISSAKLAVSGSNEMNAVLKEALKIEKSPENIKQIEEALQSDGKVDNFVDYLLFDEIPSIKKAAENLGFDGVKVWENDDVGNPSSVFIWNVDKINDTKKLKSIWNEANKQASEPPKPPVEQPPSKPTLPEGNKPSGIAKSIESKAIEEGLISKGLDKLASYDSSTIKEQAEIFSRTVNEKGIDEVRAIIRGEKPLPEGAKGFPFIVATEKYLETNPNPEMINELANSPLTSSASEAASELGLGQNRGQDAFTAKVTEIKKAREEKVGKDVKAKKKKIIKDLKEETEKINLSKEDLSWDKFIEGITC